MYPHFDKQKRHIPDPEKLIPGRMSYVKAGKPWCENVTVSGKLGFTQWSCSSRNESSQ